MSKAKYFYWNRLRNKSFSFESEQFLICVVLAVWGGGGGGALTTFSINHCYIIRQKEFSKETENSISESF